MDTVDLDILAYAINRRFLPQPLPVGHGSLYPAEYGLTYKVNTPNGWDYLQRNNQSADSAVTLANMAIQLATTATMYQYSTTIKHTIFCPSIPDYMAGKTVYTMSDIMDDIATRDVMSWPIADSMIDNASWLSAMQALLAKLEYIPIHNATVTRWVSGMGDTVAEAVDDMSGVWGATSTVVSDCRAFLTCEVDIGTGKIDVAARSLRWRNPWSIPVQVVMYPYADAGTYDAFGTTFLQHSVSLSSIVDSGETIDVLPDTLPMPDTVSGSRELSITLFAKPTF